MICSTWVMPSLLEPDSLRGHCTAFHEEKPPPHQRSELPQLVVDGQQRINSVLDLYERRLALSKNLDGPYAGKHGVEGVICQYAKYISLEAIDLSN
jgi:hypothetical protein